MQKVIRVHNELQRTGIYDENGNEYADLGYLNLHLENGYVITQTIIRTDYVDYILIKDIINTYIGSLTDDKEIDIENTLIFKKDNERYLLDNDECKVYYKNNEDKVYLEFFLDNKIPNFADIETIKNIGTSETYKLSYWHIKTCANNYNYCVTCDIIQNET